MLPLQFRELIMPSVRVCNIARALHSLDSSFRITSVLRGMQKDGVNILGRELFRVKVDIPPLSPVCLLEVRWRGPIFSLPFSLFLKSRPPAPPKSH
jgi:hypothetical protein